jgi:nucleoside-diphosphate-sugar epimerase
MTNRERVVIIGNGLIAKSFKDFEFFRETLVLASGVSNSKETRESEYLREANIIKRETARHAGAHVIYFSTCSLCNGANTPYTRHKQEMERLVSTSAKSFHIFRLPQVVGVVKNATLVSYLVESVMHGKHLNIQRAAKRYLIDVIDVARISCLIANSEVGINSVQNITSAVCVPVLDIAIVIADILGIDLNYSCFDSGDDQTVDLTFMRNLLPPDDIIFLNDYWRLVLRNYVPFFLEQRKQESE